MARKLSWFKGNLHTHTTESDGDTAPDHVAEWYHEHGYQFLVLSDHNHLTILDSPPEEKARWPLLIPGEEVTALFEERPIHIGAIGIDHLVEPQTGESVVDTIQQNVDSIKRVSGLAAINHPNYKWAFDHREIAEVQGAWAMEVFNGHHAVNSFGGGGRRSTEAMWDWLLSRGMHIYGIATDDAHHFQREFGPRRSNPGRGWVMVDAQDLRAESLLESMSRGEFYCSTGVALGELHMGSREVVVEIQQESDFAYTTVFVGQNGRRLGEEHGLSARYTLGGGESYVRAEVHASNGERAWTQPLFNA